MSVILEIVLFTSIAIFSMIGVNYAIDAWSGPKEKATRLKK